MNSFISHIASLSNQILKNANCLYYLERFKIAKLGEIMFDNMLVTKITSGGTPIEYYHLETQKTIVTDYGSKVKDKRRIHSLSDKELSSILQALHIKYYKILNRAFMNFLKEIQEQVNQRIGSDKAFAIALHKEEEYDEILVVVAGKQIQLYLPKENA